MLSKKILYGIFLIFLVNIGFSFNSIEGPVLPNPDHPENKVSLYNCEEKIRQIFQKIKETCSKNGWNYDTNCSVNILNEEAKKLDEKCSEKLKKYVAAMFLITPIYKDKEKCKEVYNECLKRPMPEMCIPTPDGKELCSHMEKCEYIYETCMGGSSTTPPISKEKFENCFDKINILLKEVEQCRPISCAEDSHGMEFCTKGPYDRNCVNNIIKKAKVILSKECYKNFTYIIKKKLETTKNLNDKLLNNISSSRICKLMYEKCLTRPMTQQCIITSDGRELCSQQEKCEYFYEKCLESQTKKVVIPKPVPKIPFKKVVLYGLEDIVKEPKNFTNSLIEIYNLTYVGWKEGCDYSEPITRSDVIVKDSKGFCVYVVGPQLNPIENTYYGKKVKVIGRVILNNGKPVIKGRIIPIEEIKKIKTIIKPIKVDPNKIREKIYNLYQLKEKFKKGEINQTYYVKTVKNTVLLYLDKLESILNNIQVDNNTYSIVSVLLVKLEDLKTKIQLAENYEELKQIYKEVRNETIKLKEEIRKLKAYDVLIKISKKIKNEKISEKIRNVAIKVLNGEIELNKREILKALKS